MKLDLTARARIVIYSPDPNHGTFLPIHTMAVGLLEKVRKRYQLNLFQYWRDQKYFVIRGLSILYIIIAD